MNRIGLLFAITVLLFGCDQKAEQPAPNAAAGVPKMGKPDPGPTDSAKLAEQSGPKAASNDQPKEQSAQKTDAAGQRAEQLDPKKWFEHFVPLYLSELQDVYNEKWRNAQPADKRGMLQPRTFDLREVTYDVRKTDSLVYPYEGVVALVEEVVLPNELSDNHEIVHEKQPNGIKFGYDGGRWVPTAVFDPDSGRSFKVKPEFDAWQAYLRLKQQ